MTVWFNGRTSVTAFHPQGRSGNLTSQRPTVMNLRLNGVSPSTRVENWGRRVDVQAKQDGREGTTCVLTEASF